MNIGITGISMVALLAALAIIAPAGATDTPSMPGGSHPMMQSLDADEDGRISRAEADTHRTKVFSELDEDGDGRVARDQFVKMKTDRMKAHMSPESIEKRIGLKFDKIDQDSDKFLSWDEFKRHGQSQFDHKDKDKDGYIGVKEWSRHGSSSSSCGHRG